MTDLFLRFFNMSISAIWAILAVLLLRLLFAKAPKWIAVGLWGIVAFRLICPFSIESAFSLLPSGQTVVMCTPFVDAPQIDSGVPVIDNAINPTIVTDTGADIMQTALTLGAAVWVLGAAAMLLYTLFSYRALAKRVSTAVCLRGNIYQSEHVDTPFILGVFCPKIYLPFATDARDVEYILAHEQAHLRRKDHLWKPLGFCLLALHWFNPCVWLAYLLLCRDIESACDESVVVSLDRVGRADYSEALMHCGVRRKGVAACPLAFGETGLKSRIKAVLHYKKCALWLIILAVVIAIAAAVCLLTNPEDKQNIIIPDMQDFHTEYKDIYMGLDMGPDSIETKEDGNKVFHVTWYNRTNREVTFGEAFVIQRLEDGKWVSTANGELYFHEIANVIKPFGSSPHTYSTEQFDISKNGKYRLISWFYTEDGEKATWIEFEKQEITVSGEDEIGVNGIRVTKASAAEHTLYIDYTFGTGGYVVRNVLADEEEYIGDGMIPYLGDLGKYRIMLQFGDTELSESLAKKFENNELVTLQRGSVQILAKCAFPSDHGFILYIGSDTPISTTPTHGTLDDFGGTIEIPIVVGQ